MKARYGVSRWFDFSDVIYLPPASLFFEQTEPFFVNVNRTRLLPPSEFECDFNYRRDGARTHACAMERLGALFGVPEKGLAVNTLSATWKFERMSLTIRTFLRELTRGGSELYERHPELWDYCRISIDRNWVRPATDAEALRFGSLGAGEVLAIDSGFWPATRYLTMWERGLFRLYGTGGASFVWNRDTELGWCAGPWSAIFERSWCLELRLAQVLPARGPGYSRLVLRLRNPYSVEQEPVDSVVLTGKDTHTLDRVALEVCAFWQLPMTAEQYDND